MSIIGEYSNIYSVSLPFFISRILLLQISVCFIAEEGSINDQVIGQCFSFFIVRFM